MREGDRLEPGMHAERAEDVANVVADRLDAQVQLTGDVVRPPAVLEQAEHLGLTWGQMRVSGPRRCLVDVRDLAEDADHAVALDERDALSSTPIRSPSAPITTTWESCGFGGPAMFRAKTSRDRRVSSGATTEVNCRPRTSPTSRRAAGFNQRMIPSGSTT